MENKTSTQEVYIDGIHDYNYVLTQTEKETIHALYYSDHNEWSDSVKGTKAIELIDNGNGVSINGVSLNNEDYLRIEQLHILLRLYATPSVYEITQPSIKTKF
jgi:hypothetical protein